MQSTLIEFINDYGYIGILLLIFVENIFPPIPSEVVLVFGGFLTTQSEMAIPLVILSATIGATLGAAVLYLVGRLLNRQRIKRLFSGRFGKTMHLKSSDVNRAEAWFHRYEKKAVLLCRCVPVVRSLISIPAGMAKMKPVTFFVLTVVGTAIWNTILVYVGVLAGNAWESSLNYLDWLTTATLVVGVVVAAVIVYIYIKRRFFDKNYNDENNEDVD